MKNVDNLKLWCLFRQRLSLQGEQNIVSAIDNALGKLGLVINSDNEIVSDEEQGEQKSADKDEPKFKVGDKIKLAEEPKYPAREIIAIKNDAYYFDMLVHLPFSHQDEWELVEQKPADEVGNYDHKEVIQTIINEQKPAWSEEDEKKVNGIIAILKPLHETECDYNKYKNSLIAWLKSLKDRVQPKQEWNDEDENIKESIITGLEMLKDGASDESLIALYNKKINWLKSLRPQNTWKPSDEQMLAIDTAINVLGKGTLNGKQLMELYKDLKKLEE